MRVLVTNAVLTNTGDAAILYGIKASLERQSALLGVPFELVVHDWNADAAQRLYPDLTVRQQAGFAPRRLSKIRRTAEQAVRRLILETATRSTPARRALQRAASRYRDRSVFFASLWDLSAADVVISSGGTYLVDHYDFRDRVRDLRFARSAGARVILWTQSMGPFRTKRARRTIQRFGEVPQAVFFRDQRSYDSWTAVAPSPEIARVVPDVAFALYPLDVEPTAQGDSLAVSVRSWDRAVGETGAFDFDRYAQTLRRVALASPFQVLAVSTCQGVPEYNIDDSRVADAIFDGTPTSVDNGHYTPHQLAGLLAGQAAVISTRMHMAILSLVCQVPVFAIAYEFKTLELFKSLGFDEECQAIEDLDDGALLGWLNQVRDGEARTLSDSQLANLAEAASRPGLVVFDPHSDRA